MSEARKALRLGRKPPPAKKPPPENQSQFPKLQVETVLTTSVDQTRFLKSLFPDTSKKELQEKLESLLTVIDYYLHSFAENDDVDTSGTSDSSTNQSCDHSEYAIGHIKSIFPDLADYLIISKLNLHFFDIENTINAILSLKDKNSQNSISNIDEKIVILVEMFPMLEVSSLSISLESFDNSLNRTIEYLSSLSSKIDVVKCDGSCLTPLPKTKDIFPCTEHGNWYGQSQTKLRTRTHSSSSLKKSDSSSKTTVKFGSTLTGSLSPHQSSTLESSLSSKSVIQTGILVDEILSKDPKYARNMARNIAVQREALFYKASSAFSSGGLSGFGSASYYSEEAHQLTKKMNQWNEIAKSQTILQNHQELDAFSVDLHGLTITESLVYCTDRLLKWEESRPLNQKNRPLNIICGAGQHSENKIAKIYPNIIKFLRKEGYKFEENKRDGVIIIKSK